MKRLTILLAVVLLSLGAATAKTRVACIGNSITYGYGLHDSIRPTHSYPAVLQKLLGTDYEVANFGHSGATLLKKGHRPYFGLPEFRAAMDFKPDIAVIHLGVNDTDPRDWPEYSDYFVEDYCSLIDSIRAANPRVRILMARLTPISAKHYRFRTGTRDWRIMIQECIDRIAAHKGVELIDFNEPLRDRQNIMPDGIHPDSTGYALLASTVYSGITGHYGGLRLAPYYQSGMVLQRHRPLTIRGTADAGAKITLTLDGITYPATADNRGHWQVLTAPLADGTDYTMTVTDGHRTINLTDILAGEVWLASGQSNMEFPLVSSIGGHSYAAASADPLLRIYDMRPIARTDNVAWAPEILEAMDTLGHFLPTAWQPIGPDNAPRFSAVAYHFARALRDSLNVPVGIISNAVGGAPAESWTDVNTLEDYVPEILVNWRRNDYVQKWAQGRADKNAPAPHRHPYEPSYLFSAGIRPLSSPDIAGVIWYQGESNAHNTELHETLFQLLVHSLRTEFRRDDLPICYVQLSSINRPSWPTFRNSQRLLAQELPYLYMAVSSDLGDSLDVHPRHKKPIGRRLARQALHHVYGMHHIAAHGPEPIAAIHSHITGEIELKADFQNALVTSDGLPPRTFEVAGESLIYHPAEAEIRQTAEDTPPSIFIKCPPQVKSPQFLRYGWQPYTRANVITTDSLPMSTFVIPIAHMIPQDIEPGVQYGLSAVFAGTLPSGQTIMAGGANFPTSTPLAPDAAKRLYRGIYTWNPGTDTWTPSGILYTAAAYGASASTPRGIAMLGGTVEDFTGAQVSTRACFLLTSPSEYISLPDLPEPVDNAAAAAIGHTIYLVGGNVGGKPSRQILALDLDNTAKGWKKLSPMPGNPRVQPTVASSGGKLYIWGGFAPRHGKNEPTLDTDGLCYDPATRKFTHIPAPRDTQGEPVSLGGGTAATLPSGHIAVAGGVNKDIFLDALTAQAPDYLNHPIAWYRFNPTVYIFDPAASAWTPIGTDPIYARAGAMMLPYGTDSVILTGGELKPRIRTPHTSIINLK